VEDAASAGSKSTADEIGAQWIGDNSQHSLQRACCGIDLGGELLIEIIVTAARGVADDA
jgi:hypothetical protein